jgi:DNA (cytosine-5)-methyltransferase 1
LRVYYNEFDPYAAQWLRNLITAGELPAGDVDERSIADVQPADLDGYDQCHFFAGIGGWPLALRLADWHGPVWTGSCPCQPFSVAGKGKGEEDERHLWPEFRRLIAECRPPVVIGEQVASKAGRVWLAGVRADLEKLGYAVGAADLCAASIGAPHIRQRLYWLANADGGFAGNGHVQPCREHGQQPEDGGAGVGLADADDAGSQGWGRAELREPADECAAGESGTHVAYADACWLRCLDGKARRVESGVFPLVAGVPNRVGRLRAYGNAIVPPLAAEFVKAYMDTLSADAAGEGK